MGLNFFCLSQDLEANKSVKIYANFLDVSKYPPSSEAIIQPGSCRKRWRGKTLFCRREKGGNWWDYFCHEEGVQIKCGEKHFVVLAEIDNPAKYLKVTKWLICLVMDEGQVMQTEDAVWHK